MSATIKVGPVRMGQICTIRPNICDVSLNFMFEQHNSETPRTQEVSASYYLDSSGVRLLEVFWWNFGSFRQGSS